MKTPRTLYDRRFYAPALGIAALWFSPLLCFELRAQPVLPNTSTAAEAMQRANNYWISNNSVGNANWARSAYYTGNQRAFRVLSQDSYHNWALIWGGANQWKIGTEGATHADAQCCGQTYIDLYRLDPQPVYIADIKAKMDAIVGATNVAYWSWIDAFYMAGPTLAKLGSLTGDTNYFEKLWLMYDDMKTRRGLYDPAESLWYRDASYFYPGNQSASGQKVFWSRGNGWVFAGLARVMQQMPTNAPHYADYATMFQGMAAKLKAVQGDGGMWRSSLYDPAQYPNPETSGTSFFTYGMAWGVRNGLLTAAEYTNTIASAWNGLTNLALQSSGRVGWCQPVGAGPASATSSNTTDFGVGAFLLACSEIYLLAEDAPAIRPWAGANRTLMDVDTNGWETVSLDASETEIYSGSALAYTWWLGANQFATGPAAQTNLSLGTNVITLKVLASNGLTYSNTATIIVVPRLSAAARLHFDFEDSGLSTADRLAGVNLNLLDSSGALVDLHGPLGSGVGGAGRALDFTSSASQGGSGPIAVTEGNTSIDFGTLTGFTVSLWLKPTVTLLSSAFARFFSLGPNGTTDRGNPGSLQLLNNGNFQPTNTSAQGYVNAAQTSTTGFGAFDMPTNQWRFVALTYDGVTLNFYGGGETNAVALMSAVGFPAGTLPTGSNWTLFVGNRLSRDRAFRGWVDDVRFYDNAAPQTLLEAIRREAIAEPIISAKVAGPNLLFGMQTKAGASYILETTTNLTPSATWSAVATNAGDGGSVTNLVPVNAGSPRKFYRYRIE